ncbi:MAG: hypothetical protein ACAH17_01605 [Candidatus Paceibacterota bacterium]
MLSRSYTINPFHNETETREKLNKQLDRESDELKQNGLACAKCSKDPNAPREWTVRDLQEGDELIAPWNVWRVDKIYIDGRSKWMWVDEPHPIVIDPRCKMYGQQGGTRLTIHLKSLSLDELLSSHGLSSVWRDGVQIYPEEAAG